MRSLSTRTRLRLVRHVSTQFVGYCRIGFVLGALLLISSAVLEYYRGPAGVPVSLIGIGATLLSVSLVGWIVEARAVHMMNAGAQMAAQIAEATIKAAYRRVLIEQEASLTGTEGAAIRSLRPVE